MARLRIRVELSGGGAGVPLHKLASVIAESQKFLSLLSGDVQIDKQPGEWLGFDFDRESLNFTAEYVGPVTSDQMQAFNAAFDGTTSLRRDTIAQFLRITEAIGEDEVIGFGLYQAGETAEPTEWRCISRRDAWRIADEVQILMGSGQAPHLPAAGDPSLGARMFGDRRNRNLRENRLVEYVREVESGLSARIEHVETQVQKHSGIMQDLQVQSAATESSFRNLLSTFETFCNQATRNIERMSPSALPAAPAALPAASTVSPTAPAALPKEPVGLPTAPAALSTASAALPKEPTALSTTPAAWPGARTAFATASTGMPATPSAFLITPSLLRAARAKFLAVKPRAAWMAGAGVVIAMAWIAGVWLWPAHGAAVGTKHDHAPSTAPATVSAASVEAPIQRASQNHGMEIAIDATEPSWVSLKDQDGKVLLAELLAPGSGKTIQLEGRGTLRVGNAGGLAVRLNGNPIGPIGPSGGVRDVAFKDGKFSIALP